MNIKRLKSVTDLNIFKIVKEAYLITKNPTTGKISIRFMDKDTEMILDFINELAYVLTPCEETLIGLKDEKIIPLNLTAPRRIFRQITVA